MKISHYIDRSLAAVTAIVTAWPAIACADGTAATGDAALVERGRYLVLTSACHDCHTPWIMGPNGPEPDWTRMLSGHPASEAVPAPAALPAPWIAAASETNTAWSGPWGVSFTANLTPDAETGLGKWTLQMFVDTIRNGRHKGRGRLVLPPMPIPMYRNFSDEDLTAIFTFLQSIPAVQNRVPEPLPPPEAVSAID